MTPPRLVCVLAGPTLAATALLAACTSTPPPAGDRGAAGTRPAAAGSVPAPPGSPATVRAEPRMLPAVHEVQAFADRLRESTGAQGGIVAMRSADGPPTIVTTGTTDARTGAPMDPDGAFQIASVTKSFTAALLLDLARDGLVDLDAPISRWVADWPHGDRITLRLLLEHRAGVAPFGNGGDEPPLYSELLLDVQRTYPLEQVLDRARSLTPATEPGASTRYSNLGYLLAGRIAELATGTSFGELLAQRITRPMGLAATWYPPSGPTGPASMPGTVELVPGAALLNIADYSGNARASLSGPSGGMISTTTDLLAWADAVLRRGIVAGHDVGAMLEVHRGGYGLGVIGVTPTGACVFSGCPPDATFTRLALNGSADGSSVRVLHDPATDVTLLVYLNTGDLSLDAPMIAFLEDAMP